MGLLVLYIPALFWVLCFSALVLVLYYNQVGVLIIRVTTQLRLIAVWFGPTVLDWYPFQHVLNVFLKCSSYLIAQPNYIYFLFFWILQWSTVFHNHCYVVLLFLFNIYLKNICSSICSSPWSSKYATATAYLEPTGIGTSFCLLWNLTLVDFCTSGTSSGPSERIYSWTV